MGVTVHILVIKNVDGPDRGIQATLRWGQKLQVGQSAWAEMSCPHDQELEPIHFRIESMGSQWQLVAQQPSLPLLLNGQSVSGATLQHGDRIQAGTSTFQIWDANQAETEASPQSSVEVAVEPAEPAVVPTETPDLQLLLANLELECDSSDPAENWDLKTVVNDFVAQSRFTDAARLIAASLGPGPAVGWLLNVAEQFATDIPAVPEELRTLATTWLKEPSEKLRRDAESCVNEIGLKDAAGWLAQAIFWSEGSLSGPDLPEAIVPPYLFTQAIAAALLHIAIAGPSDQLAIRWRQLIDVGLAAV